eukprot:GHRQ01025717.1.p1 GENE.GHRQ01025717.1~~GHRQ01025717.1.p1  ORF type:complete len:110 (+),score=34.22 GHRQ01025717.1:434-763(+)
MPLQIPGVSRHSELTYCIHTNGPSHIRTDTGRHRHLALLLPCCPCRYLPHRMAVVVVGDFPDPSAVLSLIQQHLGPAFEEAAAAGLLQLQGGPEVPRVVPDSWQHSEPR